MDTSGYFPQLGSDDPLFEIAEYSQIMKSKLTTPRHAEYQSVFAVSGGLVNWDAGPFSVQPSQTFNNTFSNTTGALSGAVNISETGLYMISAVTVPDGTPGNSVMIAKHGSLTAAAAYTNGTAWETAISFNAYLTAGSYIRLVLVTTNSRTHTTRMRITKLY